MNFFRLCLILFPFFLSCNENHFDLAKESSFHRYDFQSSDSIPANKNNPFDRVGKIHNEILFSYYYNDNYPSTIPEIITTVTNIANMTQSFRVLIKEIPYNFCSTERVVYIASRLESCQNEIIDASLESIEAKESLDNFISSFLFLCNSQEDYSSIHDYVVSYENEVLENAKYSEKEKKVLLITTSIARYSAYAKKKKPKKNKDPEWALMVGNILASVDGADESEEEAIMRAVVTGIVENKL
ncbi:hypothetical protein EZL74_11055 [Flavobacterium silvisoli]|uniref:Lipoprotein n=1 Tax=Flavobacterium silvisoli TaxID=2529433 RepID=A0A4Q9YRH5_9FLAO|nr:hypothetical protein [Flavobacterium silvisoli]TBX66119.1 hypothetical protein EZL74_11055 [Flavobacterium silvisoli]